MVRRKRRQRRITRRTGSTAPGRRGVRASKKRSASRFAKRTWVEAGVLRAISQPGPVVAHITPEPRLPLIQVSFHIPTRIVGLGAGHLDGPLSYTASILYNDHGRNDVLSVSGQSASLAVAVDFGMEVRGGTFRVDVMYDWSYQNSPNHAHANDSISGLILGDNPPKDLIRAELGDPRLQVIAYLESRFRQFDAQGHPLWGPPNGFGVMQLDNPAPNAREIWDWKANVAAGEQLFQAKEREIRQHYDNVLSANPGASPLSEPQLMAALYQYYNTGNKGYYWAWDAGSKRWLKSVTEYGDHAMSIQALVETGETSDIPDWD
jgi:hypothetical protein